MLFTFYPKLIKPIFCLILVSLAALALWLLVIQLGGAEMDLKGKLKETRKRHGKTNIIPRLNFVGCQYRTL